MEFHRTAFEAAARRSTLRGDSPPPRPSGPSVSEPTASDDRDRCMRGAAAAAVGIAEANSPEAPPARGCQVMERRNLMTSLRKMSFWWRITRHFKEYFSKFYATFGNAACFPLGVWLANQGMR